MSDDTFELNDLRVEVVRLPGRDFVCGHVEGEAFRVVGEDIVFEPGGRFSMYGLAALLPLLTAKQRPTAPNDWMTTDTDIACPDPHCGAVFRVTRTGRSRFSHAETSRVPLDG